MNPIEVSYTYEDVSLVPKMSDILSIKDINICTRVAKGLPYIRCPIISSPMSSVTEEDMAIHMAMYGGIGVLHRYNTIQEHVQMVENVKNYLNYITPRSKIAIIKKYISSEQCKLTRIEDYIKDYTCEPDHGVVLVEELDGGFAGIMTGRDLVCACSTDTIESVMTPFSKCIYVRFSDMSRIKINQIFANHKNISCIPVLNSVDHIVGLVHIQDFFEKNGTNGASLNNSGTLLVGCEVGCEGDYLERARSVMNAGCDFLSVSMGHGHHIKVIDAIKTLKREIPEAIIMAGNVSTYNGANDLIDAGADSIRCGSGLSNVSETNISIGVGVLPITAMLNVCRAANERNIPVIADGGIRDASDMIKALAAGASAVMLGSILAGTGASPGSIFQKDGERCKLVRGKMHENGTLYDLTFKGLDRYVTFTGPLKNTLIKLCKNLKSGMLVCGYHNLEELRQIDHTKFVIKTK